MESFVSGIRGELEIRAVVLWNRRPFGVECKEIDDEWNQENEQYEVKETEIEIQDTETPSINYETLLSVVHKQKIHLIDNTTLGEKLKHHSMYNTGCHVLIVPPEMNIDDQELIPVLKNLHDHIAIMRGGSAVLLQPTAHFDLKVDNQCYIVIPPNLVDKYADNAPEPMHLVVYILAIIFTVIVLLVIFYRTRHKREDGGRINLITF